MFPVSIILKLPKNLDPRPTPFFSLDFSPPWGWAFAFTMTTKTAFTGSIRKRSAENSTVLSKDVFLLVLLSRLQRLALRIPPTSDAAVILCSFPSFAFFH